VALVTFEVVDSAGTVVPVANDRVRFTVTGGEIVALDNADLQEHDPYRTDARRAFNGRGLAILRSRTPGRMTATASAEGLAGVKLSVQVVRGPLVPTSEGSRSP
jgi:beta-galactosidase